MRKSEHWGMERGWWGEEGVGRGHLSFSLEAGVVSPHIWGSQTENRHIRQSGRHPGAGPILMAHADCRIYELSGGSLWPPKGKATVTKLLWEMTGYTFSFLKSLMRPRLWHQPTDRSFSFDFTHDNRFTLSVLDQAPGITQLPLHNDHHCTYTHMAQSLPPSSLCLTSTFSRTRVPITLF